MFQFTGLAPYLNKVILSDWVVPFGHPGVTDCLHLTPAFRSLPRPSSPTGAKASALRPFLLYSSLIRPSYFHIRERAWFARFNTFSLGFFF